MFGFRNRTWGVIISAKNGTLEFALGIVKEIALNLTGATAANAEQIPEGYNLISNLPVKDSIITSTSIAVGSKITQPAVFSLIAGATQNISPFL